MDPNFENFFVRIIFIDHQTCQKSCRITCWLFSSLHFAGAHFWMSRFNLVTDEGDRSVSCDFQQYAKYGYNTHHGLCCLHAKYHRTQLGHAVVMSIWNVDAQQRQRHLNKAESCYIMSVSNKLSYLPVSIILLSQDKVTIIFTVKYNISNIAFTIKDSFEGQSN